MSASHILTTGTCLSKGHPHPTFTIEFYPEREDLKFVRTAEITSRFRREPGSNGGRRRRVVDEALNEADIVILTLSQGPLDLSAFKVCPVCIAGVETSLLESHHGITACHDVPEDESGGRGDEGVFCMKFPLKGHQGSSSEDRHPLLGSPYVVRQQLQPRPRSDDVHVRKKMA